MEQRFILSLSDAQKVIAAIQSELEQAGKGAAIAVVDEHGELIAFARTAGCPLPSINISMNKAFTAAREGKESGEFGQKGVPMTNYGDLRYCPWGGGVPLRYQGQVVGAVGVSGLPEAEDVELARMAAALIG